MRSAPPVLPRGKEGSPEYKRTLFDREGPDAGLRIKVASYCASVGVLTFAVLLLASAQGGSPTKGMLLTFALVGVAVGFGTYFVASKVTDSVGSAAQAIIMPTGNSTPYEQTYSYQEAMIMRGDIAGALESYEAIIAEQPGVIAPRLRAAEHYARANRDPKRAAELFREIRDMKDAPIRDAVYASSRLVDLYDGPLADPGRAIVELRRIIDRYPNTAVAQHARTALPALKARLEIRQD